jgi:hypothetical protein
MKKIATRPNKSHLRLEGHRASPSGELLLLSLAIGVYSMRVWVDSLARLAPIASSCGLSPPLNIQTKRNDTVS